MVGSGLLSSGRASKWAKRLSSGGEVARVGSFRGSGGSAPLLDWGAVPEWLAQLDGIVLFLHDDVEIDQDCVAALTDAHLQDGETITAGYEVSCETTSREIPVLVASPSALAGLLESPFSKPDPEKIRIVARDDVRHMETCSPPPQQPLLVASMIVRDEADQLSQCLESVAPLVDRIEIVDTGSQDQTVEIARRLGANVTFAAWDDDFSSARNVALDRARDARYVLHVDADERIEASDPIAFRTALAASGLRAVRVPISNVAGDRVTSTFEAVRIFLAADTSWVGRVHEYPADTNGNPLSAGYVPGLSISHLGYDPSIVADKDKHNRNVALAEAAYRAEPCFKTRMDLARSLAWRSDDDRAYAMFREAASDMAGASNPAAAFVLAHVAMADLLEGAVEDAHQNAEKALGLCSGEFVAHLVRARAWTREGDHHSAVDAHFERTAVELDPPMFDTAAARHLTDAATAGALARLGRFVDAIELAVTVLDQAPDRFNEWKSLALIPTELRRPGLQLLVSMDTTGRFVDELLGEVPMDELAALVLAHVEARGTASHAVVTGIMASLIAGDEGTAIRIAERGVDTLDNEQRSAAAERCRLRGAHIVATILEPTRTSV